MNTFDNPEIQNDETQQEPEQTVNQEPEQTVNQESEQTADHEPEQIAEQEPEQITELETEQEPESVPQPVPQTFPTEQQSTYRNAGAGRKESPFVDSPYMTYDQGFRVSPAGYTRQQTQPAPQKPAPAPRKKTAFWKTAVASALVLAVVVCSCFATAAIVNGNWEKKTQEMTDSYDRQFEAMNEQMDLLQQQIEEAKKASTSIVMGSSVASGEMMTPSQVYALNVDTVVMVHCEILYSSYGQTGTGTSTGSGFIISADGYVMTNYHVVEGATSVSISTHNGVTYAATVIGYDNTNDVALLKANASGLPYVAIGSSDDLIVGDQVIAIGNPLGELTSTMTVGYISGKERAVNTDGTVINMIQTDAAINSGNSGGPLFNMKGEVIGITTAKYSGASSSGATIEGIGFAIPIDDVMGIVAELKEFGYIKTAYMGVTVREMSAEMQSIAQIYNLPVGLYVDSVEPDGPAYAAGIQAEDIIIKLSDTRIKTISDLTRALRDYEPGDRTTVTVFRAGAELELPIILTEKPRPVTTTAQETQQPGGEMPTDGSYEEWYNYFFPFFGKGPQD